MIHSSINTNNYIYIADKKDDVIIKKRSFHFYFLNEVVPHSKHSVLIETEVHSKKENSHITGYISSYHFIYLLLVFLISLCYFEKKRKIHRKF